MKRLAVTVFLCIAANAAAYTTGISGYSGEDDTCVECHTPAGAAKPSASIQGPPLLPFGVKATYQLVIDTDVNSAASVKRVVGLDIATSAGTLGTVPQDNPTRLIAGEISHTNALPKAKTVQVSFTLTTPDSPGTVTLYGGVLSANGDGTDKGDDTVDTTLQVLVGPFDLGALDAVSSATMMVPAPAPDLGPPHDEARWSCGSYVGVPLPVAWAPVAAVFLVVLLLRRRRA